ncbi:MAG: 50S ribosomal protein L4 [Candidatus Levybacteria bacterium]|nr:50S ribosomal protein L4 [Candidatus Levybacteria bacterium]
MARSKKTPEEKVSPIRQAPFDKAQGEQGKRVSKEKSGVKADVVDMKGKVVETITLPQEIFGAKINQKLMAQAVRVYLTNQRRGTVSTKTRGEVQGSTRKIYRQKGTGRARHGGITAPIFVGGGVAHGPKPQDHTLSLPKKMKKAALFSALSAKIRDKDIKFVSGLADIAPKTKEMASLIKNLALNGKSKKILLVTSEDKDNIQRAARNLAGVSYTSAKRLNTYEVLHVKTMLVMKESVAVLQSHFLTGQGA